MKIKLDQNLLRKMTRKDKEKIQKIKFIKKVRVRINMMQKMIMKMK
jgi:hypothetical protein